MNERKGKNKDITWKFWTEGLKIIPGEVKHIDGNCTISLKFLTPFYQWRLRMDQARASLPSAEVHLFKILYK